MQKAGTANAIAKRKQRSINRIIEFTAKYEIIKMNRNYGNVDKKS